MLIFASYKKTHTFSSQSNLNRVGVLWEQGLLFLRTMPRGKKAKPASQSEVVKKEEEPTSEDVKEEAPKTEQEEPKSEQEGSSGDVKKEEKAGFRIQIGSGSRRAKMTHKSKKN
jgi:hypothetical protein